MNKCIYLICIIATLWAISGCKDKTPIKDNIENAKPHFVLSDTMAKLIALDSVTQCNISDNLMLTGTVSFDENKVSKIFPRGSGQVVECKVTLGDKVSAGQVLAVIKSSDIAGNYADLSSLEADIKIASRQLSNTENLYKNGIASEKELNEAKQNYEKALAAKRKVQSLISINGGKNSNAGGTYVLTAPISGYVVEKKINTGNFIRPDMGDYVFTISNLEDVWVWANVFEADIAKIKVGNNVSITTFAYPNKVFKGKLDMMSEILDPMNKALRVRIQLKNENLLLRPEMFTKVEVHSTQNKTSLCIPTKALISDNGKNFVVAYNSASSMAIVKVDVLKTQAEKTYISANIQPGQKIVVQNQLLLFQQLLSE